MWWETVSLRFHLRKWHIYGNLRQNIGQKAQIGFWKTVKRVTFGAIFGNKTFEDFVTLLALDDTSSPKWAFFCCKRMKNEWFSEPFLWDSAHKPQITHFILLWHFISDIIAFMCKNHALFRMFSYVFVPFGGFSGIIGWFGGGL